MLDNDNYPRALLFYADLLAAHGMLDLAAHGMLDTAITTVEAVIDLQRLDGDEVTEQELREKYGPIWTAA